MELRRFLEPQQLGVEIGWGLVAWLAGIAIHSLFPFYPIPSWVFGSVFAGLAVFWWLVRPFREWTLVIVVCFVGLLGVWWFDRTIPRSSSGILTYIGRTVEFRGELVDLGGSRGQTLASVDVQSLGEMMMLGPGRTVQVRLRGKVPTVGSVVSGRCVLRKPQLFPASVQRQGGLARQGIWVECAGATEVFVLSPPSVWSISSWLGRWRSWLNERIRRQFPSSEAELLIGMLYGDQSFDTSDKKLFRRAGLMHLVAVSGSNVTIVVSVFMGIALACRCSRRRAFIISSIGLIVFVFFVGASASVLRAAVMGWIVMLAWQVGRVTSASRLLLVSAFVLTVLNPWSLAFDAGFALSFLATWGLVIWVPIIEERMSWIPKTLGMREAASTTCAATLMTAPYSAWAFGSVSFAGLMTNVFAVPLVPWVMLFGAIAAVWGQMPGSACVDAPAYGLLHLVFTIARLSEIVPWSQVMLEKFDWAFLGATYLSLWYVWKRLTRDKTIHIMRKSEMNSEEGVDRR